MTIDHVIARSRGGQTVASNLVRACEACNETKAAWPLDLFALLLERFGGEPAQVILARVNAHLSASLPQPKARPRKPSRPKDKKP